MNTKDQYLKETLRRRIADYNTADLAQQRERLVDLWKEAHPEAANEQSAYLKPLLLYDKRKPGDDPKEPDEMWCNDVYNVTVRRHKKDPVFKSYGGCIQIGISTLDGTARHDWREFQAIKNQLAGPECEGFELYPAESRLIDPSNYYTLWCFPGIKEIHIGMRAERRVFDQDEALAPQRALPKSEE